MSWFHCNSVFMGAKHLRGASEPQLISSLLFEDRGYNSETWWHSERLRHDSSKHGYHAWGTSQQLLTLWIYTVLIGCFIFLMTLVHHLYYPSSYAVYCEQVVTCDADVAVDVWRPMVLTAVNRSFNQITVLTINCPCSRNQDVYQTWSDMRMWDPTGLLEC